MMKDGVVEKLMVVKESDTNRLYAVFTTDHDHMVVRGMGAGVEWAKWVTRRKLSADELAATLDPDLVIEGPVAPTQQMLKLLATSEQQVKSAEVVGYHDWVNRTVANSLMEKAGRRRGARGLAAGLAEGLQAGLRAVRNAPHDGDGDGNYARDPDGIDDDPMPAAGAVTRGLDLIERGARAIEDVARGAETRETPVEDRTPMDARVLGALGRAVRPGGLRAERERIGAEVAERRARGAKRRKGGVDTGYDPNSTGDKLKHARRSSVKDMLRTIVDKSKKPIGARTESGWALPHRVEVGNKGINDAGAAALHLKDGGDIADVPDLFLSEAILSLIEGEGILGDRFKPVAGVPSSINDPWVLTDTVSGQQIILKYYRGRGASTNEDISEILGGHMAERFGFPAGTVRVAGPTPPPGNATGAAPIVIGLASENTDRPYDMPRLRRNAPYEEEAALKQQMRRVSLKEKIRQGLLDAVLLNIDRHDGNYLLVGKADDTEVPNLYPIDHGHTLSSTNLPPDSIQFVRKWFPYDGRNKATSALADQIRDGEFSREDIVDVIKELQEDLRAAEEELPVEDVVAQILERLGRGADGSMGSSLSGITTLAGRMKFLAEADPDELYNAIMRTLNT